MLCALYLLRRRVDSLLLLGLKSGSFVLNFSPTVAPYHKEI
jgi:hypothetical protein